MQEDGPYASAQGPAYGTSTRRVSESPVVQLCYSILGLEPGATENAIKSAYRRRALKFHSDKIALEDGKDVVMTGLNTAKRILLDEPGQDHSSDLKALQEALVAMRELGGVR
ncbi:MAG: J domain-containing protein [Bacteroidota bacterium]